MAMFEHFPYYRLELTLATGHVLTKLFAAREHASEAFTLVSRCRCLAPFGPWHTDEFFVISFRSRFPDAAVSDLVAAVIPRDQGVPPLAPADGLYEGITDGEWVRDEEWYEPPRSLVLTFCHGRDQRVLERLSAEQLRDLAGRWDERVAYEEPVSALELT